MISGLSFFSSSEVEIDGYTIHFCLNEIDPAEAGYKFCALGEDQVNLLMGYDVNSGKPSFARMFRGSCTDQSTVDDIVDLLQLNNILL